MDNPFKSRAARLVLLPEGEQYSLESDLLFVGKRADNDIILEGPGVSRLHASVRRTSLGWQIEDRRSRCGVIVGEHEVDEKILQDGDEIRLGSASLRFDAAYTPDQKVLGIRVGAGVIAALVLLYMLGASTGSARLQAQVNDTTSQTFADANRKLCEDRCREAARLFRRVAARAPLGERRKARSLQKVAELFATADQLETFRWEQASECLKRAEALEGIPDTTQEWVGKRIPWVAAGERAHGLLTQARQRVDQAEQALATDRFEEAVDGLEGAMQTALLVDEDTPLTPNARDLAAQLQRRMVTMLEARARELCSAAAPDYETAERYLERAMLNVSEADEQVALRGRIAGCQRNRADAQRYADALRILRSGSSEAYGEAERLLRAVDPRSRVASACDRWLGWIDADRRTREADALYARGDARSALAQLDLIQAAGLDDRARRAMDERRLRWGEVARAWEEARALSARHDPRAATALDRVLRLESDPTNRYVRRARIQLRYLERSARVDQSLVLERGLDALRRGDYDAAHKAFEEVRRDVTRERSDGVRIAQAVRRINQERGLVAEGRRALLADDTARFGQLRVQFELLWRWLHRGDPQRELAGECLRVLDRALKRQRRVAAMGEAS